MIQKSQIQGNEVTSIVEIPLQSIPCIKYFSNISPTTFQQSNINSNQSLPFISECFDFPDHIIIATDASIHSKISAIAWVISDVQGKNLTQKNTRLQDIHISSFRAEALAVLSVFQHHGKQINEKSVSWNLFCDNKALIHRLQHMQHSEINVEWIDSNVLQVISNCMPQNGNIYHVKGHQQITEKSPIQAILNEHTYRVIEL
jgi:hypothetical protein